MSRTHGSKGSWLAALDAEAAGFRAAVTAAESLDAPVPPCPDWTLRDLVCHLGSVYEWISGHVVREATDRPAPRVDHVPAPGEDLIAWWDARLAELTDALAKVDPQMPAWNWAPQAKTASFWHRRAALETTVHRWDAQIAVGHAEPIEASLAADGVAEVLDSWLPAGRRKGPTDRSGMVHLVSTDPPNEWFVRLRGAGVALLDTDTILDTDSHHERVAAAGPASDLLLALYGRVGFDVLEISGDASLLSGLRTG
jgi:uncharacterized protein (TIGR03083 family)